MKQGGIELLVFHQLAVATDQIGDDRDEKDMRKIWKICKELTKSLFLFIALEGISLKPQNWKRQWDGKKHLQTLFTNMLKYRPTGRCCLLLWDRLQEDDLLCKDWQKIFILWLYQISQRSCQISSHQCKLTRKNCRSEFTHVFTASMWGCRRPMRWTHFALLGFTASTSRALQGTLSLATEIKTSMSCPCHPCPNRSFYLSNPIDIWSCHLSIHVLWYPCNLYGCQKLDVIMSSRRGLRCLQSPHHVDPAISGGNGSAPFSTRGPKVSQRPGHTATGRIFR